MKSVRAKELGDGVVRQLERLTSDPTRRKFLARQKHLLRPETVDWLYEEVVKRAHVDLQKAERLAQAARCIARQLKNPVSRAQSLRALGHIRFLRGSYSRALSDYKAALVIFRRRRMEIDVGRTLNGALQSLIYLGQYSRALNWARQARRVFKKHGDRLRLARLDSNVGNILYRQDRFPEALRLYQRAMTGLRRFGEPQDVAAVLSNMAVCSISLNDFTRAERIYREARKYCQLHHLSVLLSEADYNIAYLYYLRGEYTRAVSMYQEAREHCERMGDVYHRALCDLDQSEMYLELNLSKEGEQLAEQAFEGFRKLGMGYEAAKALTNLAIAASHEGRLPAAMALFDKARRLFIREQNRIWPALIDVYRALVFYQADLPREAGRLSRSAVNFFSKTSMVSKTALCELLLTRLHLQSGKTQQAEALCRSALKRLHRSESPSLTYQAYFVLGQVYEAAGDRRRAMEAYRESHSRLENLRSQIRAEELKIAFLKDKLAVFESLVWMSLAGKVRPAAREKAFNYIEQAKSRSLADLIAFRAQSLPSPQEARSRFVEQVHHLREELNWCYHQIDSQPLQQKPLSPKRIRGLHQHAQRVEGQLLRTLSALAATDKEFSSLQSAGCIRLDDIRAKIPADALLLEYFQARGTIYASLLGRECLQILPVARASRVRILFHLLQFQLSKFRLGMDYVRAYTETLREATQVHLSELYQELVAPVRDLLQASHLIVVPHDFLHYLPFHALRDGERYLIDEFSISYAPSASVYYLCCTKRAQSQNRSVIFGIPDQLAPQILPEVQAVASELPNSQLFLGEEANEKRLRSLGSTSRFVHIATHGLFRRDNPMFSAIRLGDSMFSLFDFYQLNLSSELVTLSGCSTGSSVVVGGDELLGLVRGVLYSGAQAVLVTLWDVNDKSTADFMKSFYRLMACFPNKAQAVQRAIREVRQEYPHPYYWAPFVLIGNVTNSKPLPGNLQENRPTSR